MSRPEFLPQLNSTARSLRLPSWEGQLHGTLPPICVRDSTLDLAQLVLRTAQVGHLKLERSTT